MINHRLFFVCLLFCANKSENYRENLSSNMWRSLQLLLFKPHDVFFKVSSASYIFTFSKHIFTRKKKTNTKQKKNNRMLSRITMFAKITSNPLLLHLIERTACNLIFRVNAHRHWRLLPYHYINWASKSKVLFGKLNENRGEKRALERIMRSCSIDHNALLAMYRRVTFIKFTFNQARRRRCERCPSKSGLRVQVLHIIAFKHIKMNPNTRRNITDLHLTSHLHPDGFLV